SSFDVSFQCGRGTRDHSCVRKCAAVVSVPDHSSKRGGSCSLDSNRCAWYVEVIFGSQRLGDDWASCHCTGRLCGRSSNDRRIRTKTATLSAVRSAVWSISADQAVHCPDVA